MERDSSRFGLLLQAFMDKNLGQGVSLFAKDLPEFEGCPGRVTRSPLGLIGGEAKDSREPLLEGYSRPASPWPIWKNRSLSSELEVGLRFGCVLGQEQCPRTFPSPGDIAEDPRGLMALSPDSS